MEFPLLKARLPAYSFVDIDTIMLVCTSVFGTFQALLIKRVTYSRNMSEFVVMH